jgi:mono/diheme cytochrome c family protein
LLAGTASGATVADDRATAHAALADIRSTIADIVAIENGFAVGHQNYIAAAERARNGIVGSRDREYVASAGTSSDAMGALAHIDALLDRKDDSIWTPAMQGAKINLLAAEQSLSDALHEKQMEDYETDLTTALSSLSLAIGRPTDSGVLGGIQGALAATTLGVPSDAAIVSGCSVPAAAPSYGILDGNLMFVSVPRTNAELSVPSEIVVDHLSILPQEVVLYTHARSDISRLCAAASASPARVAPSASMLPMSAHKRLAAAPLVSLASQTTVVADDAAPAAGASAAVPTYTAAQAHAGATVYAKACISCHGANLQGVAGPAVAGKEFLASVASNKWTYADLRNLVTQQMPLNNPGSLTPTQYASVLAYLLAENCFPASTTAFPETDSPALAQVKFLAPTSPVAPTDKTLQTCAVH